MIDHCEGLIESCSQQTKVVEAGAHPRTSSCVPVRVRAEYVPNCGMSNTFLDDSDFERGPKHRTESRVLPQRASEAASESTSYGRRRN